jgi:hypothetical protein
MVDVKLDVFERFRWREKRESGWADLNRRPLAPQACNLPNWTSYVLQLTTRMVSIYREFVNIASDEIKAIAVFSRYATATQEHKPLTLLNI